MAPKKSTKATKATKAATATKATKRARLSQVEEACAEIDEHTHLLILMMRSEIACAMAAAEVYKTRIRCIAAAQGTDTGDMVNFWDATEAVPLVTAFPSRPWEQLYTHFVEAVAASNAAKAHYDECFAALKQSSPDMKVNVVSIADAQ